MIGFHRPVLRPIGAIVLTIVPLLWFSPPTQAKDNQRVDSPKPPAARTLRKAEEYNDRGVDLIRQGKLESAIEAFEKAIQINPVYENALNNLGIALGYRQDYAQAEARFRQALAINPNNFETHNNLGIALGQQQKLDEAEAAFREAVRLNPADPEGHQNLGLALLAKREIHSAIQAFEQARILYDQLGDSEAVQQIDGVLQRLRNLPPSEG